MSEFKLPVVLPVICESFTSPLSNSRAFETPSEMACVKRKTVPVTIPAAANLLKVSAVSLPKICIAFAACFVLLPSVLTPFPAVAALALSLLVFLLSVLVALFI